MAEQELDRLVKSRGNPEGYEGNAQSFRIVTRLAARRTEEEGLDLTRATLCAILKYPWPRDLSGADSKRAAKFGFYDSEREDFDFARVGFNDDRQSVEASIMDQADSIAYSVHDLDDFFRAGLVPIYSLRSEPVLRQFLRDWQNGLKPTSDLTATEIEKSRALFIDLIDFWPADAQYTGTLEQRKVLRWTTSQLINRYIMSVKLAPNGWKTPLLVPDHVRIETAFLQQLVRVYVINNPRLATQQAGQRRIIASLYSTYYHAIRGGDDRIIPPAFQESVRSLSASPGTASRAAVARIAADIVASLSDQQAHVLFRRICGIAPGSVGDMLEEAHWPPRTSSRAASRKRLEPNSMYRSTSLRWLRRR